MKKEPIILTVETVSHREFMAVANEANRQLEAGNRVVLEVAEGISERSVRAMLVGRYIPHPTVAKLIIRTKKNEQA